MVKVAVTLIGCAALFAILDHYLFHEAITKR